MVVGVENNINDDDDEQQKRAKFSNNNNLDSTITTTITKNRQLNSGSGLPNKYLQQIVELILQEDLFRNKLLKLVCMKSAVAFEQAFPKRSLAEQFEYIGSGSYAQVYRQKITVPTVRPHHFFMLISPKHYQQPQSTSLAKEKDGPQSAIIKLIDVFSENLIKNLLGTSSRSSVSTYRDVYNEFRVSLTLSYLSRGVLSKGNAYQCNLFPNIYDCFMINTPRLPDYFEKSRELKRLDYEKLLEKGENGDSEQENWCRSRLSIREVRFIKPEVAAIKMEDCGQSLHDQMKKFRPIEILSVAKQILLGFVVAESAFQFEHRDLHMGNILIVKTSAERLRYVFKNRIYDLPSHNLMVKVIDTTFSRLKIKKRVYFRDLSHLFDEKDFENRAFSEQQLVHQDQTYQAMASEIKHNWHGHYPRTNLLWLIYILKKFYRQLKKNTSHDSRQVQSILKHYSSRMINSNDLQSFFEQTMLKTELNRHCTIRLQEKITTMPSSSSSSSNMKETNHNDH